ncbi:MAG: malate dehydrogenase [Candidatus Thermoplasmatota archaeon]|nr:malate dehydrogenase [Candidatus Thermoplasmatota archaeon]MBU4144722.1 malate dehydrogenase [Candidatus Thermoplasmatota archaeon]MBU4591469.1 malate dehydrogenase [Candidatus Thermoplasmatota archaeon]
MRKISVIGAGRLGSTIAFSVAKERVADELVIIDIIENLVKGESLDMGQACLCPVIGSTDYSEISGSGLIIIVAGIARKPDMTREQLLGTNVKIMKSVIEQVAHYAPSSKLLIVSNPMDSMTYVALKESGFDWKSVFGMGGVVDSNRFRYFLAREFDVHIDKVQATVVGQHGEIMVPLASSVQIEGATPDLEKIKRAIERTKDAGREVIALKGATFYAPAHATSIMARIVMNDEKAVVPSSVYLEEENVCIGMPITLGRNGVEDVKEMIMTPEEREQFTVAARTLRDSLSKVGY